MMYMKKGISPFLATIFLIAITIGILGLIGPQLIDVVGEQAETTVDRASRDIDCSNAGLNLHGMDHENSRLELDIENTGLVELTDFRADIIYDTDSESIEFQESDVILPPGERMLLINETFDEPEEDYDNYDILVVSETCPSHARDER